MPGHTIEGVTFKQPEMVGKYTCPVCHLLLQDAVQPSCGHWLCQTCADTLITKNKNPCCPREFCKEPFTPEDDEEKLYFPDRFVRKEILTLSISCKFSHQGCQWSGKFGELAAHVKMCRYNTVQCKYCCKSLRYDNLESHLKSQCPSIPKRCPLSKIGCHADRDMTVQQLQEHLELDKLEHMELLVEKLSGLEAVVYTAKPPASSSRRGDPDGTLDSGFGSLKSMDIVEKDCATTVHSSEDRIVRKTPKLAVRDEYGASSAHLYDRKIMSVMQEEVTKLRSELKSSVLTELKAKNDEIESLKSTVMKLEKSIRSKTADFEDRDFRLSLIENSNYDGTMVWKIPQFSQRMTDAQSGKYTSIFSLPFYTGRYGYKMCLRLYILGDGIGKGGYMSLFFVLMKGEFDNILQWPFTHKVTFKLINQGTGRDVVDTFQPDPMSSSFKKPRSDMNIASGCPRFVSHTDLKNGGYIFEDTVFIKCVVDTSAIKHP